LLQHQNTVATEGKRTTLSRVMAFVILRREDATNVDASDVRPPLGLLGSQLMALAGDEQEAVLEENSGRSQAERCLADVEFPKALVTTDEEHLESVDDYSPNESQIEVLERVLDDLAGRERERIRGGTLGELDSNEDVGHLDLFDRVQRQRSDFRCLVGNSAGFERKDPSFFAERSVLESAETKAIVSPALARNAGIASSLPEPDRHQNQETGDDGHDQETDDCSAPPDLFHARSGIQHSRQFYPQHSFGALRRHQIEDEP